MAEVTIKIPEDLKEAIVGTGETIYVEALKEVVRRKLPDMQKRLRSISRKLRAYESRYGRSYEEFCESVPDTIKGHDDWIEWSYLIKLADELSAKTARLTLVLGKQWKKKPVSRQSFQIPVATGMTRKDHGHSIVWICT
jgi:hypothetical protein